MEKQRYYLCIDLKSFYASVECVERGLDTLKTDLVVADEKRTKGTICLAVSPSLKEKGVKNRCRLFQIPDHLLKNTIIAPPRMQKYIDYATRIYGVYLEYVSKEDIYVYSIDEAFIDVTDYLKLYQKTPREMAVFLMEEVFKKVGVRATAGIGTNLYLSKVALDITAKHAKDYIGELDEKSYQEKLWDHKPLTDFWRIGPGISKNLESHSIHTMGELARADEDVIYQIFGKNAELLIDHAWGREPVTIDDIKNAKSKEKSYSMGQVLPHSFSYDETLLAAKEMSRELCLRLIKEHYLVSSISLSLGFDYKIHKERQKGSYIASLVGLPHGAMRLDVPTNSTKDVSEVVTKLYQKIADQSERYRRVYLGFNHLVPDTTPKQMSLFEEPSKDNEKIQSAIIDIQRKFGKLAIMRGEDLETGSTHKLRSGLIGGHKGDK